MIDICSSNGTFKIYKFLILDEENDICEYFFHSININYKHNLDYIRSIFVNNIYNSNNLSILDKIKKMEYLYIKNNLRIISELYEVVLYINKDIDIKNLKFLIGNTDIFNYICNLNDDNLKNNYDKNYNPNLKKSINIYKFCLSINDIPFDMSDYTITINDYLDLFSKLYKHKYIQLFIIYGFISKICEKLFKSNNMCFSTGLFLINKIIKVKNLVSLDTLDILSLNYLCDHHHNN